MPQISWKLWLVCCVLALVGGGSFLHASKIVRRSAPKTLAAAHATAARAPMLEPDHDEPTLDRLRELGVVRKRDATGNRFPGGLTLRGGTKHRLLLFTFDDGPSRQTTPRLLDTLDDLGMKAVFFVTSETFGNGNPWERQHADIVRDIVRRGHMIGNHTETHRQLPLLNNAQIDAEIRRSEGKIAWTIGRYPRLIRPPGGALSKRVQQILSDYEYTSVLWAIYPEDLQANTPEQVVRSFFRVLDRREQETGQRGGIVLMHDTKPHTVAALPRIVEALERRNCALLEAGEELYDIVDDLGYFIPGYEPDEVLEDRQASLAERTARRCRALAVRP